MRLPRSFVARNDDDCGLPRSLCSPAMTAVRYYDDYRQAMLPALLLRSLHPCRSVAGVRAMQELLPRSMNDDVVISKHSSLKARLPRPKGLATTMVGLGLNASQR